MIQLKTVLFVVNNFIFVIVFIFQGVDQLTMQIGECVACAKKLQNLHNFQKV